MKSMLVSVETSLCCVPVDVTIGDWAVRFEISVVY